MARERASSSCILNFDLVQHCLDRGVAPRYVFFLQCGNQVLNFCQLNVPYRSK